MNRKVLVIVSIVCAVLALKVFNLEGEAFELVKSNQAQFKSYYNQHPAFSIMAYFVVYVVITALSIPMANVLTLLGGALFGFGLGLLVISFASSIGATFAFLIARNFLREFFQKKYGEKLKVVFDGFEKDGAFYLFSLRLIPIVPFFFINITMGLTNISVLKYFLVSQIGMLAGTAVYVNAGVGLANLDSLSGLLSPQILGSFALLGIFPLAAKKLLQKLKPIMIKN